MGPDELACGAEEQGNIPLVLCKPGTRSGETGVLQSVYRGDGDNPGALREWDAREGGADFGFIGHPPSSQTLFLLLLGPLACQGWGELGVGPDSVPRPQ